MAYLSKRRHVICAITFSVCFSMLTMQAFSLSLEQEVCRRQSMRSFTSENVSGQQLLDVLWAAYGYTNQRRNTPQIGSVYSLMVFTLNQTGSYRYIPESNSLAVHDLTVNKETLRPYDSGWPSDAKEVLVIAWDSAKMGNQYFASAEAGCLAQNVHLAASSQGLGTCVIGSIESDEIRDALNLPSTLTPLLVMPLSFPSNQYPAATPEYDITSGNLLSVQYSRLTFEDSLKNMVFAQEWSAEPLSLQELSQLLWAAYGYSSTGHRTTPSAYGIYPLVIYVSNATGIYQYLPESHSVKEIVDGDKRFDIAGAFSGQVWAADAPTMFLVGYDSAYNGGFTGDGGVFSHLFMEVNAGCVIQQLFLEASAVNLQTNILSEGFEEWNGAGAQQLRGSLGLSTSIIPLYAIPVGASENADRAPPTIDNLSQDPANNAVEPNETVTVSVEVTDDGGEVSEVVLYYSTNGGQTWASTTMTSSEANIFTGEIPSFEEGKFVQYKVVAYDNSNNVAVEDNTGDYYIYTVIPEFQNFLITIFIVLTAFAVILAKKRNSHK